MQFSYGPPGFPLIFGASQSGNAGTLQHLHPGYSDTMPHADPLEMRMPRAGRLRNMYVRANGPGTGTGSLVYTFTINGAPALTVSVAATGQDGSETATSVPYDAGALIGCTVIADGVVNAGGHGNPCCTVEAG